MEQMLCLTPEQVCYVREILLAAQLGPPNAAEIYENEMLLVWDQGQKPDSHYFEISVQFGAEFEWFYRNRLTGIFAGDEHCPVENIALVVAPYRDVLLRTALS